MNKTEESIDMGMGVLDQDMTPEEIAELEMEAQLAAEQLLAEVQQAEHQVELNPSVEMLSEMSHSYMLSPTLASLPQERRPKEYTVCQDCPLAMWHHSNNETKCYCRMMHIIIWTEQQASVMKECDGRHISVD